MDRGLRYGGKGHKYFHSFAVLLSHVHKPFLPGKKTVDGRRVGAEKYSRINVSKSKNKLPRFADKPTIMRRLALARTDRL